MNALVVIGSSHPTGALAALRWFLAEIKIRYGWHIKLFHLSFENPVPGVDIAIEQEGFPSWLLNGPLFRNVRLNIFKHPLLVWQMIGLRLQLRFPSLPIWLYRMFLTRREKYDVAISYMDGFVNEYVRVFIARRHIGWCHEDYARHQSSAKLKTRMIDRLSLLDGIFCVSKTSHDSLLQVVGRHFSNQVFVFHNLIPITTLMTTVKQGKEADALQLVTVARMERGKRLSMCLDIASELKRRGLNFDWTIYGDGPLRTKLLHQLQDKGLFGCVRMPGANYSWREKVFTGSIFVYTSMDEGWGLVIEEAVSEGAAVVCTDLPVFREVSEWIEVDFLYARTVIEFADQIEYAAKRQCLGKINVDKIRQGYEFDISRFHDFVLNAQ